MIVVRCLLAVLSAGLLLTAIALLLLGPSGLSFDGALRYIDSSLVEALFGTVDRTFGYTAWMRWARPIMSSPAWICIGALGTLFLGVFLMIAFRSKPGK